MSASILAWYRKHAADASSDIAPHFPRIERLIETHRVRYVVELGVRWGHSTSCFVNAVASRGHVWSVDIGPAPYPQTRWWTFIQGNDTDPAVAAQLPDTCDLLFIDTSHAYEHTVAELALYGPRVRPGGLIVLHDTANEHPELMNPDIPEQRPFPVYEAMIEYADEHGKAYDNDPASWGLGVIYV